MSRILVTGSTDGIGLETARRLLHAGHDVVGHARDESRAAHLRDALPGLDGIVTGDLGSLAESRTLAEAATGAGPFDVVVHNAGIGGGAPSRVETADGLEQIFQVNTVAPYVLTALVPRPGRLVYLTSGLEGAGEAASTTLQWTSRPWDGMQAYRTPSCTTSSWRSRSRGCGQTHWSRPSTQDGSRRSSEVSTPGTRWAMAPRPRCGSRPPTTRPPG